jgi:hypothetical protein
MNKPPVAMGVVTQQGNIQSGNTGQVTVKSDITTTTYPELREGMSPSGIGVFAVIALMLCAVAIRARSGGSIRSSK